MSLRDSGQYYHEVLKRIPPRALPAFEDEAMQERVWGRRWGVSNDVGTLRTVLVHRPGDEIGINVIGIAFTIRANRRDDGDVVVFLEIAQQARVDLFDIAHQPEIAVAVFII